MSTKIPLVCGFECASTVLLHAVQISHGLVVQIVLAGLGLIPLACFMTRRLLLTDQERFGFPERNAAMETEDDAQTPKAPHALQ